MDRNYLDSGVVALMPRSPDTSRHMVIGGILILISLALCVLLNRSANEPILTSPVASPKPPCDVGPLADCRPPIRATSVLTD